MSLLDDNNIPYQYNYRDKNCIFDNGRDATFDFYVNNQYYIEFDGEQHFRVSETSAWKEKFERIQLKDKLKNEYCLENNIPLIRIPYNHLSKLTIDDLKLETTNFLVQ